MAKPRLSNWLGNSGTVTPRPAEASLGSSDLGGLLQTLRKKVPGQWSQNVVELSRHFTSAAFLAINTRATQGSGSKLEVFERTSEDEGVDGVRQLPWHDPICELFEDPNPEDTYADLIYQTIQQRDLTGVSLTWAPPLGAFGEPTELYCLPSATAWPMPPSPDYPQGAYRVLPYPYGLHGAPMGQMVAGAVIPAEQIVRIKNHHPYLRYDGYAVLTAMSLHVDTLEAIDKARNSTQQQGCDQTLAIELSDDWQDPTADQITRLRQQLHALYAGPQNSGKLFIAPKGAKATTISTTPREMAWTEGWSQILDFVLAAFGTPKSVAGLQDTSSYATLYASLRAFTYLSLGPCLSQIGGGWTKHLIRPTYGRQFFLSVKPPEFRDESLIEQQLNTDLKYGGRLIKELRKLRGLDALDEKKYPWVNDRAFQNAQADPEGGKEPGPESAGGGMAEDPGVNNARPTNGAALGSMGKSAMGDLLADRLERAKTNGHAFPIKG